jgi:hypothetical protein
MSFGKAFKTLAEAKKYKEQQMMKGNNFVEIRKMSKKLFPHRSKLYHVGSELDFLNFT